MHLNIKRNQQESNILLDSTEMKLNMLLSKLNNRHVLKNYKEIVKEDEFQRFEGVTYENLTLSQTITNKINHINGLIDELYENLINQRNLDNPTTTSTTTTTTTNDVVKSLIPERDFYFKTGHTGSNKNKNKDDIVEEVVKKPRGFQKKS